MPESKRFLQSSLDALSAHVAVLDADGTILAVNAAWRRFAEANHLGAPGHGVGENYIAVCERGGAASDDGRVAAGIRAVASGATARFVMDYAWHGPTERRWFQLSVTRFADGDPVRLVVAREDVTARKLAEDRLRASDERYRAFLEQSSEAIWRFELAVPVPVSLPLAAQVDEIYAHAHLAECNDATARMYGWERAEDLVGAPLADFLPRDDPSNVHYLEAFVSSGYRLTDAESHELDRDGRPRIFHNNLIGIVEDGRLLRAWGTQRDVTDQKHAEAAVRDSEHKLRLALDAADLAIWEWHPDGTRTLSANYADVVGMAPVGHDAFLDIVHPADRDELVRRVRQALQETGVYRYEYRVQPPGQRERWLAGYGRVVPEENGKPKRMIGVVMDVTGRRRAEIAQEESRRTVELALEVARAGAWEWVLATDAVLGDASLARLFHVPAADLVGGRVTARSFQSLVHPDDVPVIERQVRAAIAAGGQYEAEFRVRGPESAPVWLRTRGMVHLAADGRPERLNGLVFDVTSQKLQELDATFLAEIGERIRLADDADALVATVAELLGRHLGGAHCLFGQADGAPGWSLHATVEDAPPPAPGESLPYPERLLVQLETGHTVVIADAAHDPLTHRDDATDGERSIRGAVVVPQLRGGRWMLALAVLAETPRDWTAREVALIETVAERTWNAVEKLRLDARLRESEQRYRSLVMVTTAIVSVTDSDGRFTSPQPDWERFTGQPWEEHAGYGYLEAVHPEDRAAAAAAWADARERKVIFEHASRLHHAASGTYRYCVARVVPVFAFDGSVREWVSSVVDVDEQRRAEMRLRASEAEWRLVFESARDFAILTMDLERRITRWNPGATRLLGYEENEIVGHIGDVFFTPEDRAAGVPQREVEGAARLGRAENERWHLRKDGSRFWSSGLMMPLESERGATIGFVKIMRDMTASKRAGEEREELLRIAERARAEAESANSAKDSFLATLSHELRSPLQAAIGWVTLLRSGNLAAEQRSRAVATLERSIRHQVQLVNDLLDVSRILTGKLHLESSLVDLGLVIEQVREELQVEARNRGLELTLESDDCGMVLGDPQRLGQIFRNLIGNALKFTANGGRVAIRCVPEGESLVVTVTDTGQGIASDFLPHLFDRFSQADSSITRQHGGLGLGLGIVRHLVGLHGGTVGASSPGIGRGSTFEVRLPMVGTPLWPAAPTAAIAGVGASLERGKIDEALAGVRVFVVEDEAVTREALAIVLQEAGARVTATGGAREALELLAVATPDVIVTDLGMPGEDGYWLAQRVRGARLAIPMVALTGFADADTRARVLREGMHAHLAKPVDPHVLIATVRTLLGRRGSGRPGEAGPVGSRH